MFAVKHRLELISAEHQEELFRFVTGIVRRLGQKLLAIGGMADHVHLLLGLRPDTALADLVWEMKAGFSKFLNERRDGGGQFAWQEGYGAFSYSASHVPVVIANIRD